MPVTVTAELELSSESNVQPVTCAYFATVSLCHATADTPAEAWTRRSTIDHENSQEVHMDQVKELLRAYEFKFQSETDEEVPNLNDLMVGYAYFWDVSNC